MSKVAVVGVGAMGSRVARRLMDAGHDVTVWNRTPTKTTELIAAGAGRAQTPADAAEWAEAVITMVADPEALRDVTESDSGLARGADVDTTFLEMSTVGPDAIAALEASLPDGAALLDAPVLGSISEAEEGTLHVFVGGPAALFERWAPLLSVLGTPLHVGPLGAGARAKLVANLTLFTTIGALGEALALARGLGLSREVAFEVLAKTPLGAQAARRRSAVESADYPRRFALSLALKDARLVREAAQKAGVDVRLASAAAAWLADAVAEGRGEADYSSLIEHILESGSPRT